MNVQELLESHKKSQAKFKKISVEKHLECNVDLGYLLCSDPNTVNEKEFKDSQDDYIRDLTRDNVQLIVNELWELPVERVEETVVAKLPAPKLILPRSRKIPTAPLMTKWQKFAQDKGIVKKKKDKKTYDNVLETWVPTYGFKRAQAEKDRDWVLEVPKTADPMEDQFAKKQDLRNEKVAKNEIQRMKNIARAHKVVVPRTGYLGPDAASSKQLLTAATVAKSSTGSVGKFQEKLSKDKPAHGLGVKELVTGSKRKPSHVDLKGEKSTNLHLADSILNKKPKMDLEKAVSLQKQEDKEARENQPATKKTGQTKKMVNARRMGKKPKGGKGVRNPSKKAGGRKRR